MTTIEEIDKEMMSETINQTPFMVESYSKVKLTKNTKGINIEITASGKDYQDLPIIRDAAINTYFATLSIIKEKENENEKGEVDNANVDVRP